jgi:hypothetical protein
MSLRRLRKTAKLNLCEDCYRKYMMVIEPTIKRWLTEPLRDWGDIEHNVTQMVMKLEGVFKTEKGPILISIGDDEHLPEEMSDKVDLESFRKIERWGMERKIEYLRKHNILKEHSFKLLDRVREIRNKLHDYEYKFTEQELNLISQARPVVSMINWAVMWLSKKDTVESYKDSAEKTAEKLLISYIEKEEKKE